MLYEHYTMIYKNGERKRDFLGLSSFLYFGGVYNDTIIPLALVGYEIILGNIREYFPVFKTARVAKKI